MARCRVWASAQTCDVAHRAGRHPGREQALAQLLAVMVHEQGGELGGQLGAMAEPVAAGAKARVVGQPRRAEFGAQPAKRAIVADRQEDIDRARRELVVRAMFGWALPVSPGTRPEST